MSYYEQPEYAKTYTFPWALPEVTVGDDFANLTNLAFSDIFVDVDNASLGELDQQGGSFALSTDKKTVYITLGTAQMTGGNVVVNIVKRDTWASGKYAIQPQPVKIIGAGTNTTGLADGVTVTDTAFGIYATDALVGSEILITSGGSAGFVSNVTSNTTTTGVIKFGPGAPTNIDNNDRFEIRPASTASNLTAVLGTDLTETSAGDVADAMSVFFDVPTNLRKVTEVGDLLNIQGQPLTGTAAQLADAFTNMYDVVTPTKTINDIGNLTNILGTALTETNSIAAGLQFYFDVAAPSKTMEDVGGSVSGTVDANVIEWIGVTVTDPLIKSSDLARDTDIVSDGPITTTNGVADANVEQWKGTVVDALLVLQDFFTGDAPLATTGGKLDTVITAENVVVPDSDVIQAGSADAGGSTTVLVDAVLTDIDNFWRGCAVKFTDTGEKRLITSSSSSGTSVTFKPPIVSAADGRAYELLSLSPVDVGMYDTVDSTTAILPEVATVTDGAKENAATVNRDTILTRGQGGPWTTGTAAGAISSVALLAPANQLIPESGTVSILLSAFAKDAVGAPVDFDASPTWSAKDFAGNSLDANLRAHSTPNPAVGEYQIWYDVASSHPDLDAQFRIDGDIAGDLKNSLAVTTLASVDAVTVDDITPTALAKFANTDTAETVAVAGSVAELSQGEGTGGGGDGDDSYVFNLEETR